jgi:rSAM/selenodomain-associated transferase 1
MAKLNGSYSILDPRAPRHQSNLCALAVMTKAPKSGISKTRLIPPLSPAEAAALSACFLRDTCVNVAAISSEGSAEGIVVYTPAGSEDSFEGLLPANFSILSQRGSSFGDRLFFAAADLLAVGYESLCLVGADSPTLPPALLRAAVSELAHPGDRLVLGTAADGGYYLIGLKKAHRQLFADIDWSTSKVLSQTIERAADIGLEVALLPPWYDVDDAATLRQLCDEFFSGNGEPAADSDIVAYHAPYTRDYLSRLIGTNDACQRIWGSRC